MKKARSRVLCASALFTVIPWYRGAQAHGWAKFLKAGKMMRLLALFAMFFLSGCYLEGPRMPRVERALIARPFLMPTVLQDSFTFYGVGGRCGGAASRWRLVREKIRLAKKIAAALFSKEPVTRARLRMMRFFIAIIYEELIFHGSTPYIDQKTLKQRLRYLPEAIAAHELVLRTKPLDNRRLKRWEFLRMPSSVERNETLFSLAVLMAIQKKYDKSFDVLARLQHRVLLPGLRLKAMLLRSNLLAATDRYTEALEMYTQTSQQAEQFGRAHWTGRTLSYRISWASHLKAGWTSWVLGDSQAAWKQFIRAQRECSQAEACRLSLRQSMQIMADASLEEAQREAFPVLISRPSL